MIHNIKNPILSGDRRKILIALRNIDKLPEPTIENTWHPNTQNLLSLRDWFFSQWYIRFICLIPPAKRILRRISKFVIILYDFDPPWRWIFDSLKDEAFKLDWNKSWVSNLNYLRDWLLAHCFPREKERRRKLISIVLNSLRDVYRFLPVKGIFHRIMNKALSMEWKSRGFEDTWKYDWWVE